MRRRLTAVFAGIVAAFIALDLVVILSLWPEIQRSEALSSQYAVSMRLLARMRGDLHAMRSSAIETHVQLRAGAEAGTSMRELLEARRDFEGAAAEYGRTPMHPEEEGLWRELFAEAYPELARLAEETASPAAGEESPDIAALTRLGGATDETDRLLQRLAVLNAEELTTSGREIHESVHTLILVCLAIGVVGIIGGVLLVRWALSAVSEYERITDVRLRELDDFAGRVAHDLRNPLQAIGMSLALIRLRTDDERTLATCAKAEGSARRMSEFIQELLTFARSGANPSPDASAEVEQVLREVEQDLAPEARARNIQLLVNADAGLSAAIAPEALRAVVVNLAENAVKHMPADGDERRVEVSSRSRPGEVEILVRDTGAGISPEALPRLFDPFFRATEQSGGFGIGLKTVKRLVDAHRGRLLVDSEPGRGTLFTVFLPASAPPAEPAPEEPVRDAGR